MKVKIVSIFVVFSCLNLKYMTEILMYTSIHLLVSIISGSDGGEYLLEIHSIILLRIYTNNFYLFPIFKSMKTEVIITLSIHVIWYAACLNITSGCINGWNFNFDGEKRYGKLIPNLGVWTSLVRPLIPSITQSLSYPECKWTSSDYHLNWVQIFK